MKPASALLPRKGVHRIGAVLCAAVLAGTVYAVGTSPANAAQPAPGPSTCPPVFTAYTADQAWAQALANGAPEDQETWFRTVFWPAVNTNGDAYACQQNGSVGRALGQPSWYANWVDNNAFGQARQ